MKIGTKIECQFIEPMVYPDSSFPDYFNGICRYMIGTFQGLTDGGLCKVWFEQSNVEVITVPWAVKKIKNKKKVRRAKKKL